MCAQFKGHKEDFKTVILAVLKLKETELKILQKTHSTKKIVHFLETEVFYLVDEFVLLSSKRLKILLQITALFKVDFN